MAPSPQFSTPCDTLEQALGRYGFSLPGEQVERLSRFCQALWTWNERLNLTRHTDFELFVTRDLVDTLAFAELLGEGERVLDVGTGGGAPGVILAVVRPDLRMAACESVQKKFNAVADIVKQVGVKIELFHARAEDVLEARTYDSLVVRAVAPLPKLLYWLAPHWDAIGQLLVVKGRKWTEERQAARERGLLDPLELRRVATYTTPGADRENYMLKIWREGREEEMVADADASDDL